MKFLHLCLAVVVFATMIEVGSAPAICTDAILTGVFGSLDNGTKSGQPEATLSQINFDGAGNATGTVTNSKNGTVTTGTFTATYSVASDCTGSMKVTFQGGTTANLNFVLDNLKKGAQIIRTDSGLVKSGFSLAQGIVTCGLTGRKQIFALNMRRSVKTTKGTIPITFAGEVVLDGKGNISGSETLSQNGVITTPLALTGTYTEESNCTGTAHVTPMGLSAANFDFVVVSAGKEILLIETDATTTVSGTMQQ